MKRNSLHAAALALALLCAMILRPAAAESALDVSTLYKNKDVDADWSASEASVIDLNALEEDTLILKEKGDYVLSGDWNGLMVIEADTEEKVRLILNVVSITSPQCPAIYEKQADKLIITLAEGTENTLTDGAAVTDGDDTISAALYAEDDLSINGSGSLMIQGTQKHGIQSKADLIVAGGEIQVNAVLDGLRGRNSVLVLDGNLMMTCGGDGIVSTRADAEGKGWIVLAGGSVTIKTGDGAGAVRTSANAMGGFGGRGRWDDWGDTQNGSDSEVSQKAVKAATDLTVLDGTYCFDCADDGLHGVNVTVQGGNFEIQSGDDGMHADEEMTVNGGSISISQCYEGLEGKNVTVNGGEIRIVASDDGINASGGNDGSGFGGWGRGGGYAASGEGGMLTITGGQTAVTAGGDGLDSNGSIALTGGVVGIWTESEMHEGPIDFNGTGTLSGVNLIIASTGGMMQDMMGLSGQSIMSLSTTGTVQAGGEISLLDENGNVLATFAPENEFNTVMVSSGSLPEGAGCQVLCDGTEIYSGEMSNNLTASGNDGADRGFGRQNRKGR